LRDLAEIFTAYASGVTMRFTFCLTVKSYGLLESH